MALLDAYAKVLKRKNQSLKIKKETRGTLLDAESASGVQYMELRRSSIVIMENVPADIFQSTREQLWLSETARKEHPVKVKANPELKKKLRQFESELNEGESTIQNNMYKNNYFGFTVMKPDTWTFKPGHARSRVPVTVGNIATSAYMSVQVTTPTIPISPELLDINIKGAAHGLLTDFNSSGKGSRIISGYYFSYIKGTGIEKSNNVPCEVAIYGGNVRSKVFLMICITPTANITAAEADFNYLIQNIRFN